MLFNLKHNSYAIYICESLAKLYLPKPIHTCSFHDETFRLQTYILMSWIKIVFFGSRLRSWSFRFLCNLLFASLFIHALWVSTPGTLQTSLDIHPKPRYLFVITSLTTTYYLSMDYRFDGIKRMASCEENFWEAIKNSPEIQMVLRRRRRIRDTYLSQLVLPLFILEDEHSFKHGGGGDG